MSARSPECAPPATVNLWVLATASDLRIASIDGRIDLPDEAGQEWAGFWSLLYASFYDESRIQDR